MEKLNKLTDAEYFSIITTIDLRLRELELDFDKTYNKDIQDLLMNKSKILLIVKDKIKQLR